MSGLLCLWLVIFPVLAHTEKNCSLVEKEMQFVLEAGVRSYTLPDSFLFLDSEAIEVSEIAVDPNQYRIDYNRGTIEVPDSLGARIRVHYQILPFPLKPEYCHRRRVIHPAPKTIPQENYTHLSVGTERKGLQIGGKKTLSLSVGSRDELTLNQSLELRLAGEISGVAVSGVLSDKDSNLDPGGTRSIEELDNVYMEVETDQFKGRIGDYELLIDENRFCRLERRLEGVTGSISMGGVDIMAAGAITRRHFHTNSFAGEDGKQGPYQLRNSKGTGCSNLVSGSERVYLDGELLERGEVKDYVIDYELGMIEFTPRRLITSESRIVVDFEYSADRFQKRVYGAKVAAGLPNNGLMLVGSLFAERDSPEAASHASPEDKVWQGLSDVEADTAELWIDGGELVGENAGDYVLLDGHYQFVGGNSGNYRVNFTHVGEGKGDYVYERGRGGFEWVGEKAGSYVARIHFPLPHGKSLYDLKLTYCPIPDLSIEYEHAFSRTDLNIRSADDEVRHSEARAFECALVERPIGPGELTFATRLRNVGRGFSLSSCATDMEEWYMESNPAEHRVEEIEALYSLPLLEMGVSVGNLHCPDGNSSRQEFSTTLNPGGSSHAFLNYENILYRGTEEAWRRRRRGLGFGHRVWHLSPSLSYTEEVQSGDRSREYEFLVDLEKFHLLSGRYEHTVIYRECKDSIVHWRPDSDESRDVLILSLDGGHTRAQFNYTRRNTVYMESRGKDLDYSLASLSLSSAPIEKKVEIALNSVLTSKRLQRKEVAYTRVNEGEGDYIRDPETGDYYAYEDGDYVREVLWTGGSEPILGFKVEFQSRVQPTHTFTLYSRLISDREVRNRDQILHFEEGLKAGALLDNTLEISSPIRGADLRLNHRWSRRREEAEEEREEARSLGLSVDGSVVDLLISGTEEFKRNSFCTYVRREEKKRRIEGTEIFRLPPFTFSLLQGMERKQVHLPNGYGRLGWIPLNSIFARPLARFDVPFKGSLESSFKLCFSTSGDEIPQILRITDPPGWAYEWINILNYWVNGSTSSTLVYEREKKGFHTDNRLKAEMRGDF